MIHSGKEDILVKRTATKVFGRAGLGRPLLEFVVGAQQLTLTQVSEGSLALDLEVFQTPLGETGKLRLHLTQEAAVKLGDLLASGQDCTRDDLESGVDGIAAYLQAAAAEVLRALGMRLTIEPAAT